MKTAKLVSSEELEQRRLLRHVERVTGQRLPHGQYGCVVIDNENTGEPMSGTSRCTLVHL